MRWVFILIFLFLFQVFPVYGEDELNVQVRLSSAHVKITPPKSLLSSVFVVTNTGQIEDIYVIEANVPDGWQIISSLNAVSLSPNESRSIPLTVSVPSNALTGYDYDLILSAHSQSDPKVRDQDRFSVSILPRARIRVIGPSAGEKAGPGQTVKYRFVIINLGNGKDIFEISASSAHGEKVEISDRSVELAVGEKKEVMAVIHIPMDVSSETMHVLTLRAASVLLERGVSDKVIIYTSIVSEGPREKKGIYKTLPAQMTTHISGIGTGRAIGTQAEFYTAGYIDDKHWMDFSYQGPYFKDKENYQGFSRENISFNFGDNAWDIGLGDTTVNLSELTTASLSERGVKFHANNDPLDCMIFGMERKQSGFSEELQGGRIIGNIGEGREIGLNFFQANEDKTDSSAARAPEEKKIVSLSTLHRIKDLLIQGEYGSSRFDYGSGEKKDSAWWINSRLKEEKFRLNTEYIHAGSDYPGRRRDNAGYRAYLSYNVLKKLWAWVYRQNLSNNLKNDPDRPTDNTDRVEIGTSFIAEKIPFISLSYGINKTKSEQQVILSDNKEDVISLKSQESFGPLSASLDCSWSKENDDIKTVNARTSDYTTRIYRRWDKFNGWLGYNWNIENDIAKSITTTLVREEIGISCQPSAKFFSGVTFSREGIKGRKENQVLSFNANYNISQDSSFILECEMRDDHTEFIKDWQFWITFRSSLDIPLPLVKVRAFVEGAVFIDENNNGLLDKEEKGMPGIIFFLGKNKAVTNGKGRFKFPAVFPGDYGFNMDISSVPVGLAPSMQIPQKVILTKGETLRLDIPLVRVCRIKGVIFEDKNKNGLKDEGERGLPLVRILVIKDSVIYKDTFSDKDGRYAVSDIIPGKYNIAVEDSWFPDRYMLMTQSSYDVTLAPQDEIDGLNFGAAEKEKQIIKTYVAPELGTAPLKKNDEE
ncbi:MAG: SdrD B-like domain-containing protein [Candidatus Omnitrophota bacterium]